MKKSILAFALLGALGATTAIAAPSESVQVTFKGTVQDAGCTIKVGMNGDNTVNLGNIRPQHDQETEAMPVSFKFTGCTQGTITGIDSYELIADMTSGSALHSNVAEGKLKTKVNGKDEPHLTVKLYNTSEKNGFTPKSTVAADQLAPDSWVATPFWATLKTDPTDAPQNLGDVTAKALFMVTYK